MLFGTNTLVFMWLIFLLTNKVRNIARNKNKIKTTPACVFLHGRADVLSPSKCILRCIQQPKTKRTPEWDAQPVDMHWHNWCPVADVGNSSWSHAIMSGSLRFRTLWKLIGLVCSSCMAFSSLGSHQGHNLNDKPHAHVSSNQSCIRYLSLVAVMWGEVFTHRG